MNDQDLDLPPNVHSIVAVGHGSELLDAGISTFDIEDTVGWAFPRKACRAGNALICQRTSFSY